jgi:hypothetical protein
MPPKRKASARGRPRRNTRSTYATAPNPQGDPEVQDEEPSAPGSEQPVTAEVQLTLTPTPEQLLHQLQGELQRAQQERDRLAAAAAANQRAALAAQQSVEVRNNSQSCKQRYEAYSQTSLRQPIHQLTHPSHTKAKSTPNQTLIPSRLLGLQSA